jgi:hypothetical protein
LQTYDLIQCVDRGLERLGSSTKQAIYMTLTMSKGMSLDSITERPEVLTQIFQEILGKEGSALAERWIVREIRKTFGIRDTGSFNLLDALEAVRGQISGIPA